MPQEITTEEAKLFLERITPNKNYLYIFQPSGLADILCVGGLSYAVQRQKNKSATVLIVNEGAKNFGINYKNVAKISYIEPQILNAIRKYLDDNDIHETDNLIYGYFDTYKPENFTVSEGLNLLDYYRKKVFHLPESTPCRPPIITPLSADEISYWNKQYTFDKERTIILSIYFNSKNSAEIKFWGDVIQRLQEKNYIVYQYAENFFDPSIPNVKKILANFSELSYMAKNVKCFIGSRIGVSIFLAMATPANVIFLNQFPAWFWNIHEIFPNSNGRTLYIVRDFFKSLIYSTYEDGAIVDMEVSHPKINQEDMFYLYEEMLESVWDYVEKL